MSEANAPTAVFNVADFEAADTAVLELQNRKGTGPLLHNGQPVRLELYGPGSRQYLSAQHKQELAHQAASFAAARGKPVNETVDGRIEKNATHLAALTRNVENFPLTAVEIYSNPRLGYISQQAGAFLQDWANF